MHHEGLTNAGKKEARQINQVIDKAAKEGNSSTTGKEPEARTTLWRWRLSS